MIKLVLLLVSLAYATPLAYVTLRTETCNRFHSPWVKINYGSKFKNLSSSSSCPCASGWTEGASLVECDTAKYLLWSMTRCSLSQVSTFVNAWHLTNANINRLRTFLKSC